VRFAARWLGDTPWFAQLPNGADITVRQLMNHTSGLVRYEFDPAFARDLAADPLRTWRVDEQLAYVLGKPAPFAAGTSWEYSDTNYLVLALVLERILGGEAYDAIRTRFLQPLRLRGVTAAGLGTGARSGSGSSSVIRRSARCTDTAASSPATSRSSATTPTPASALASWPTRATGARSAADSAPSRTGWPKWRPRTSRRPEHLPERTAVRAPRRRLRRSPRGPAGPPATR
jgi:CubicO group peptidase (beta-lactamase class C family)